MVGQTKDAGWNIGVSKTLPYPVEQVWATLVSEDGLRLWLGEVSLGTAKGERYETADGTVGEIRSFHPHDRVRLTWQPKDWTHDTTVQVAVSASGGGTRLGFHQEWLADAEERERQRAHWRAAMDRVVAALS
jgi:uncharacterized protein YndB with AHSA1/START domain